MTFLAGCADGATSAGVFDPYGADQVDPVPYDVIRFGTYPQGAKEPEPIEWLVLEERGSKALLLAKRALDCKPYDNERRDTTWEECTLREWLNTEFLSRAFTQHELARVVEARIVNADNELFGTEGGEDTLDRVFLLSQEDAAAYFEGGKCSELVCYPTDYAVENGAYVSDENGGCGWWLRSPGFGPSCAASVGPVGYVNDLGDYVDFDDYLAVRPALWVSDL